MVRAGFPAVTLIANAENVGFARANNQGIRACQGRYIVLLNSDTVVPLGALAGLVAFMDAHSDAGAVGPRLLRPDGTPQPYAFGGDPTLGYLLRRGINRLLFRRPLHDWATDAVQQVDWVSGACLLARRAAIEQAGLLDENIFMYFEDNDWCLRIRQAGWRVYFDPQVAITHIGGQSLAQNPIARRAYRESLRYFYAKHYGPAANLVLRVLLPFYARLTAVA
jgi:GT2 family glycosyltransferase